MLTENRCFYIEEMKDKILKVSFSATVLLFCLMSHAWTEECKFIITNFSKGVDGDGVPMDWELVEKAGSPIVKIKNETTGTHCILLVKKVLLGLRKIYT